MNIVYMTTNIKPGNEVVVSHGYHLLTAVVPSDEVTAQAYLDRAPRQTDMWRGAAFKLTDTGLHIYQHGTVGPPPGFQEWPAEVDEPDWDQYPLEPRG